MPSGALVNPGLLLVKPKEQAAQRVGGVVGQLVARVRGAGFQPGKRNSFAGEKLGGEF